MTSLRPKHVKLALSGAGFTIVGLVGAVCAFMDSGYTIDELAGSSAGSIVAAFLAAGKTSEEIRELAFSTNFKPLLRLSWGSLLRLQAYCNGVALRLWLFSKLGTMRFSEVSIPLKVIATDLGFGTAFRFDARGTPSYPIAQACRASSAVPFVYAPVKFGSTTLVDAGVVNNIPVNHLSAGGWRVGVEIQDKGEQAVDTPVAFAGACINAMLASNEGTRTAWAEASGADMVLVDASGYGFLNTNLTNRQKHALFQRGYAAAMRVIAAHESQLKRTS